MDQFSLLRLIIAIVDKGSLASAARSLGVSPSTVTLGLQRLEEKTGARLLGRSTRRISLTSEGERFVADARRILDEVQRAYDSVAERGPLKGPIVVSATHDFGRARLAPLIDAFIAANPEVRVTLNLSDSVVDLSTGAVDFAMRICPPAAVERQEAHLLRRGTRKVCAAPAYWDRMGRPRHPTDLVRHNCLFVTRPDAPESSWSFTDGGKPLHVRVSGNRTTNDGGAIRAWACMGAGVLLNASFDVEEDIRAGRLEPALESFTAQDVNLYAVTGPGRGGLRRVTALIDHIRAALSAPV